MAAVSPRARAVLAAVGRAAPGHGDRSAIGGHAAILPRSRRAGVVTVHSPPTRRMKLDSIPSTSLFRTLSPCRGSPGGSWRGR